VDTGDVVKTVHLPLTKEVGHIGALIDPAGQLMWIKDGMSTTLYHLDGRQVRPTFARFPAAVTAGGAWKVTSEEDARRGNIGALVMGGADRPWLVIANDDRNPRTIWTFSPDGRYMAGGNLSGTVTVIDLAALQRAIAAFEADLRAGD
jgi:hypothetical protein